MLNKLAWMAKIPASRIRATAGDLALVAVPDEVKAALALTPGSVSFDLNALPPVLDWPALQQEEAPSSQSLFTNARGQRYPCWLPGDENLVDDWLLGPDTYPYYFRVFRHLGKDMAIPRLLEFGVRTGYTGLVFARASGRRCMYVGVDPNLYLPDGLDRAAQTFRLMREEGADLDFMLLEGYSSSSAMQASLRLSGPYGFVHIDGEHTYFGKVLDLWIARQLVDPSGYVLIDDMNHHPMITQSVQAACYMGWFSAFSLVPTKRGLGVLKIAR